MAGSGPGPKGADKDAKTQGDDADVAQADAKAPDPKHLDAHKPKNSNDSSPKHDPHAQGGGTAKQGDDAQRQGVDASKTGQALEKILNANQTVSALQKSALKLQSDAQKPKIADETIAASAQTIVAAAQGAKAELDQAWPLLNHQVGDLMSHEHLPVEEAKRTTLQHPGLHKAVHDLTYNIAHLISAVSGVSDARPKMGGLSEVNGIIAPLTYVEGNLGLPQTHYKDLIDLVELKISAGSVNLGTGRPRDQIQEHVITMKDSWNTTITNMSAGLERFVRTVDTAALKEAPDGMMDKVWDKALDLLKKGAAFVSGTELAGKIGIDAIQKIVSYGKQLEANRVKQDQETFIQGIKDKIDALQLKDGESNPDVHKTVQALDDQFIKTGKSDPEDEYKDGDHAVFGAQAQFLKGLESKASSCAAAVPTIQQFETDCYVEFINANHKLRNNSAWRSPFEGPQSMDGYVRVDLTLYPGGVLGRPDAGKLHCPKSDDIAKNLSHSMGDNLSMWDLNTNLVIKVTPDEVARRDMPELYAHDRSTEIKMNTAKQVEGAQWLKDYWNWILRQCGTSTYDVLSSVRKLEG